MAEISVTDTHVEESFNKQILDMISSRSAPWMKPWAANDPLGGIPHNPITGEQYNGMNALLLLSQGKVDSRWMTIEDIHDNDCVLREGATGQLVEFWQSTKTVEKTDAEGKAILDDYGLPIQEELKLECPEIKLEYVFNVEDITLSNGLPLVPYEADKARITTDDRAQRIGNISNAFHHSPTNDAIAFRSFVHEAMGPSRLNIAAGEDPVNQDRRALRADLAEWLLTVRQGFEYIPSQYDQYLGMQENRLIDALKDNPFEIKQAVKDAEKIVAYINDLEINYLSKEEQQTNNETISKVVINDLVKDAPTQTFTKLAELYKTTEIKSRELSTEEFDFLPEIISKLKSNFENPDLYELPKWYQVDEKLVKDNMIESRVNINMEINQGRIITFSMKEADSLEISIKSSYDKSGQFADKYHVHVDKDNIPSLYAREKYFEDTMSNFINELSRAKTRGFEYSLDRFNMAGGLISSGAKWTVDEKEKIEEIQLDASQELKPNSEDIGSQMNDNDISMETQEEVSVKVEDVSTSVEEQTININDNIQLNFEDVEQSQTSSLNAITEETNIENNLENTNQDKTIETDNSDIAKEEQEFDNSQANTIDDTNIAQEPMIQNPELANNQQSESVYINIPYENMDSGIGDNFNATWDRDKKSWFISKETYELYKEDIDTFIDTEKQIANTSTITCNPITEFKTQLQANGFKIEGDPKLDGKIHRVPLVGSKPNSIDGAYFGKMDGKEGKPHGWLMNYKTGVKKLWNYMNQTITQPILDKLKNYSREKSLNRETLKTSEKERAKIFTQINVLNYNDNKAKDLTNHPYLLDKGIAAPDGVLYQSYRSFQDGFKQKTDIIIPAYSSLKDTNDISNIQTIQVITSDGNTKFLPESGRSGAMFLLDSVNTESSLKVNQEKPVILIATDFASSKSLNDATGLPVVCAFENENLTNVSVNVRKQYPNATLVICGDKQHLYEEGKHKQYDSYGEHCAKYAASLTGALYVAPDFNRHEMVTKGFKNSNFNDLYIDRGLEHVKSLVSSKIENFIGTKKDNEISKSKVGGLKL